MDLGDRGLSAPAAKKLEQLDRLLADWGRVVDLTGFRDPEVRRRRYFEEAFAALSWVPETGRAMDIGSGGGSPALPLAIARPRLVFTLVESNERKAVFLDEAVRALGLDNVRLECTRYERTALADLDLITVRGVSMDGAAAERVLTRLAPGGRFLWFSGRERLEEGRAHLSVKGCRGPIALVPGGGHLLVVEGT